MIKDFLNHLSIKVVRTESNQFVCNCPFCADNGPKLYVNQITGLWDCKRGCGDGNPYKLAERLTPLEPAGIMALLEQYGLNNSQKLKQQQQPKKPLDLSNLRKSFDLELVTLCTRKQINHEALLKFRPVAHKKEPWVILPAYDPSIMNMDKPCGLLRVRVDGQPIRIRTGIGDREVKYPITSGSTHGLFGLRWITEKDPDTIIFCEAWRDALAIINLGFFATASSGGASTWRDSWLPVFKDKVVYICMDTDKAGARAAERAAEAIIRVAKEVRIVFLPYNVTDKHGKDLHDYIVKDGHSKTDFGHLLKNSTPVASPPAPELNYIILDDDYPDTIAEAFEKWSTETGNVKHRHHVDTWTIFKNGKYKLIDESEIKKWVRKFCRHCRIQKKKSKTQLKITTHLVNGATEALSALPAVWIRPRHAAPSWLNDSQQSQPKDIISLQNCLLNITNNNPKQLTLTENYYTLNYLPFEYDTEAQCPGWIEFVESVFTTKKLSSDKSDFNDNTGDFEEGYETVPDQTSIHILQEFMGYLLSPDTSFQKILGIVGPKRSGKSTIGRIIRELVGCENASAPTLGTLTTEFGLQGLINKTVAIIGDANIGNKSGDIMRAVERLKSISGEDAQQINRKNQKFIEADRLNVRFVIIANELQNLIDPSGALASRFVYLITTQSFYGKEDIHLFDSLKTELPGIFNWALKGLENLRNRGHFLESEAGREAKDDFTELTSPITAFVKECCILGDRKEIATEQLYTSYKKWCEENGRGKPSSQRFKNDVRGAFSQVTKCRKRLEGWDSEVGTDNRIYCFVGVDLKPEYKNASNY